MNFVTRPEPPAKKASVDLDKIRRRAAIREKKQKQIEKQKKLEAARIEEEQEERPESDASSDTIR